MTSAHFKTIAGNLVLAALACAALLLLGELGFRVANAWYGNPWVYRFDGELGWVPKGNFGHHFPGDSNNRDPAPVAFRTNEYGFRHWGKLDTDKPRILFVGDSFTYAENVSDQQTYYAYFANNLPAEVFATGGSGYGTLQEIRLVKRFWDRIQPQYFVLQFCSNDFMNNHLETESFSFARLQKNFRPYLIDGSTVYRNAPGYRLLVRHSQLFRFMDRRAEKLQVALYGRIPSAQRAEIARLYPAAEATTRAILESEYQPMVDTVPSFTFMCNERDERARAAWIRVAGEVGIQPIGGVAAAVEDAEDRGVPVRAADGAHWNDRGHEIVGKVLVEFFRAKFEDDHRG